MSNKKNIKVSPKKEAPVNVVEGPILITKAENFFQRNGKSIFWIIFGFSFFLALGLFDMKISLANDDALYLEAGNDYAQDFFNYFYKATAPLYTMVVGLLISIFGFNLGILKFFSTIFFMVSLFLMFRAFKNRIPYTVLFGALFITGTNYLFLIHAALTYTECFFAMVQMIFMWVVFNLIEKTEENKGFPIKAWLLFGVMSGVLYMTRNVASFASLAVFTYFILYRNWKNAVLVLLFAAFFIMLYECLKSLIWDVSFFNQFEDQGTKMVRKEIFNPADPNNTAEKSSGYIMRLWGNAEVYIGGRLWEILGIAKENGKMEPGMKTLLTIFTILLMLPGYVFAFIKKNKAVLIPGLYFAILSGTTYVGIHTVWAQARLIMIYLPFIFIVIFYGWYQIFQLKKLKGFSLLLFLFMLFFMLPNALTSLGKVPANIKPLSRNLSGDEFYGYTTDWVNFFKASRYCARELPEGSYVASGRGPMSYVYGDFKKFYGVYSLPSNDPDELLNVFREHGVTHFILAELRINPNRYIPNRFINTMHRYVITIASKYPNIFELVHTEGTVEKAEVYKIRYDLVGTVVNNPNDVQGSESAPQPQ